MASLFAPLPTLFASHLSMPHLPSPAFASVPAAVYGASSEFNWNVVEAWATCERETEPMNAAPSASVSGLRVLVDMRISESGMRCGYLLPQEVGRPRWAFLTRAARDSKAQSKARRVGQAQREPLRVGGSLLRNDRR